MSASTRTVCDGLYFGEAPRWHGGRLWFSDFYDNAVKSVSADGDLRTELKLDDRPSGLGWMPDGSLLVVSMTKRRVLRVANDGSVRLHADLTTLAPFHCNDMVVDPSGRAFVGNFGFDLDQEIATRGVENVIAEHVSAKLICIAPDGILSVAAEDMHFPNGTVITPDRKTLIVGETLAGALTAFDLSADGRLTNRRLWAPTWPRVPDGIALNADGAIWVANPIAPECVLIGEGGKVLQVIDTSQPCFACMLGGDDGHTLFMLVANTSTATEASKLATGKILAMTVDSPHAGYP